MDTLDMTLLFDYYGDLLTERQRMCFDLRHNQDLSLGEIAQELQVSRQGVHDNLNRAETLLRNMEAKTGLVKRDLHQRRVIAQAAQNAKLLTNITHGEAQALAREILDAVAGLEE